MPLGNVDPKARAVADEVMAAVRKAGKTVPWELWGKDSDPGNPEHYSGLAIDFMCTRDTGDWIADYLLQNASRLGVKHVIWRQRIQSTVTSPGQWRAMPDRGNATKNHFDHVHVLLHGGSVPAGTPQAAADASPAAGPDLAGVSALATKLRAKDTWVKVGKVIGGGALLAGGILVVSNDLMGGAAAQITKVLGK